MSPKITTLDAAEHALLDPDGLAVYFPAGLQAVRTESIVQILLVLITEVQSIKQQLGIGDGEADT